MTVKHLRSLQKQKVTTASASDPGVMARYKQGYTECVQECIRFMNTNNNLQNHQMDQVTRQRLITNLVRQFHSGQPNINLPIHSTSGDNSESISKEQQILDDNVDMMQSLSPINPEMAYRRSSISPISGTSECSTSSVNNYYNLNNSSSSSESFNEQSSLPCSPKALDSTAEKDNCWRPW